MCKWGNTKKLQVTIPAHLSHTGVERVDEKDIDSCIYEFVKMLNDNGIITIASCCGHGKQPTNIALYDGREVIVARNFDEARIIHKLFPPIN